MGGDGTLFIDSRMEKVQTYDIAGGTVVAYCDRAPGYEASNQDSAAIFEVGKDAGVLVVADGAGGMPSGDKASALAIDAIRAAVGEANIDGNDGSLRAAILNGFERADEAIRAMGVGAATTLAVIELQDGALRPYHVGDSSILVVGQRHRIRLATVPHSPVGYAVEAGVLDPEEALHHEDLNVVSNLVGTSEMRIEVGASFQLAKRDTVVVGSDGLFDNLHLHEIIELIRKGPLDKAGATLAKRCKTRMAGLDKDQPCKPDDLSFLMFRLRAPKRKKKIADAQDAA